MTVALAQGHDFAEQPRRCLRCKWNTAVLGEPICWTCAIGIARRNCPHDGTPELLILRTANGYQHPKLRCRTCYKPVGSPKLRDIDPATVEGEVRDPKEQPSCARCGSADGVEVHHWAPWHLFRDADDWPTSPLCPDCHRIWHVTTGTAGTAQPGSRKLQALAAMSSSEQGTEWSWSPDLPF